MQLYRYFVSQRSEFCRHDPLVLLLNECLLLFISLSTQSGNFWIHPRTYLYPFGLHPSYESVGLSILFTSVRRSFRNHLRSEC